MKTILVALLFFSVGYLTREVAGPRLNLPKINLTVLTPAQPTPAPEPVYVLPPPTPAPKGSWMYDNGRKTSLDKGAYGQHTPVGFNTTVF